MNKGEYYSQLNNVERLFERLEILHDRNKYPNYQLHSASEFRKLSYQDTWNKCYSDSIYDFRLNDDSLIQLRASFNPLKLAYSYLESPYLPLITFEDYLLMADRQENTENDPIILRHEYELIEPTKKDAITPLRYDYNLDIYKEGIHPASHLHMGFNNNIRIATERILKPISFVLFILRQNYPNIWIGYISREYHNPILRNIRVTLDTVENDFRQRLDELQLFLA